MNPEPQEAYIRIAVLDSAIESQIIGSILEERKIPHLTRSYHDTAYDGLFQAHKGWGDLRAPAGYREAILEILEDLRKSGTTEPEPQP